MVMVNTHLHLQNQLSRFSRKKMSPSKNPKGLGSVLLGSAFLMATSAIGPGFITQTTVFTEKLTTSFGFVILCSIILDIIVQLNIWRVIVVSGLPAQELANKLLHGSGYVLSTLIILGGLAFNIGNIAGAALGLGIIFGINMQMGVWLSVAAALLIFWYKEAGKAVDWFSKILGIVMMLLTGYIAFTSNPPVVEALKHSIIPESIDTTAIIILVGGTVGGYISFAGIHRLLNAGVSGPQYLKQVTMTGIKGIVLASVMRVILFLAALGVVMKGGVLDPKNPAASVFELSAGQLGLLFFGIVLWAASITSVVGSAYTSMSFLSTFRPVFKKHQSWFITIFICISAVVFTFVGRPIKILVLVGALNGFILPFALVLILFASRKTTLVGNYAHPKWLSIAGWLVIIILTWMTIRTLVNDLPGLWN
jgi:Mn2+/Fe2+ NRAMP family transporter